MVVMEMPGSLYPLRGVRIFMTLSILEHKHFDLVFACDTGVAASVAFRQQSWPVPSVNLRASIPAHVLLLCCACTLALFVASSGK